MPKPRRHSEANSMAAFVEAESHRMLEACTKCGRCLDVCPMAPYAAAELQGTPSPDVVGGVLDVLRGEKGSPQALAWIRICTGSAECVPACPHDVNPKLMLRIGRMIASGGTGAQSQFTMVDDITHFPRMRGYATMQLSKDELDEWL